MAPACAVPGCDRGTVALGLCMWHYKRQRAGKPLEPPRGPEVGSSSGYGRYGILEDDGERVMCHECGRWLRGVGGHLKPAHQMTAAEYRQRHGLPRGLALESSVVRARRSELASARVGGPAWRRFEDARDPAAAAAGRDADAMASTITHRRPDLAVENGRRGRRPRVVTCACCATTWCPLPFGYSRVVCSPQCHHMLLAWVNRSGITNAGRDGRIVAEVIRRERPYAEVAVEFGLTPERVGQIVRRRLGPSRNEMIVAERAAGATMTEIAARHGITKVRVHQILRGAEND